jgi:outer membrane receptor for Fe3+-dicitrate
MRLRTRLNLVAIVLAAPGTALAQTAITLPPIDVVSTSPLPTGGVERDKIPEMVRTVTSEDFSRTYSLSTPDALLQNVAGVQLNDVQGNSFLQDLRYRGFAASPLQGTPQGLAVYVNGMRINEAFGDTVNWDLIPASAIDRADVWTANPVFGLNALGGAVSIQMKNGFTYHGTAAEAQAGSYGRAMAMLQPTPRLRASPTAAGATSRRRVSSALTATWAGGAMAARSTSPAAWPRTSSGWSGRRRSRCWPRTTSRSSLGRKPRRTRWLSVS